jgi:hypothetical protein
MAKDTAAFTAEEFEGVAYGVKSVKLCWGQAER